MFAALLASFIARPAEAFIGACHHGLAKEAFVAAQWPLGAVSPPLTREQQPLTNEVAIDAPSDATFWTLSALVGNHYPDGGPFNPNDLISLAEYAARPEMQRAHCLR